MSRLRGAVVVVPLFLLISGYARAQETDSRVWQTENLTRLAQEAIKRNDQRAATAYMAESLALWAEILWDRGETSACERHFWQARQMGWTGDPPWGRERHVFVVEPKQEDRVPIPRPEPLRRRAPAAVIEHDYWEQSYLAPPSSSRNAVWHGLLGIPPFEDAAVLPPEVWLARGRLELTAGEFEETSGGGVSEWDAVLVEESFQVDYGVFDFCQVGLRLTTGELLESGSTAIRIFDGGTQIVPTGRRGWGPSEMVLRGKVAWPLEGWSIGGLAELKIPLADEEDLLTSGTIDIGLVGLVSWRREKWGIHANAGVVLPVGSADLFEPEEDPGAFFVMSVGVTYRASEPLVVALIVDANTSGWSDIDVIDEPVISGQLGMRWRITEGIILAAGVRMGAGELSGGAGFFAGVEAAW